MNKQTSLIITTYNHPQALALCLHYVSRQRLPPAEIIVADDGSSPATKEVIDKYALVSSVPVIHVWQEDNGFRLAQIRNKAIACAKGAYIIQIDGDVLVHPKFVHDHLNMAQQGCFVIGSRVNLTRKFSEEMLTGGRNPSLKQLILHGKEKLNAVRMPAVARFLKNKYKTGGRNRYYAKGCNMAFWKADLLKVNGYNEDISGWGSEDEELAVRLIKSGARKLFLKMGGIVFHIWHQAAAKDKEEENKQIMQQALHLDTCRCTRGIDRYIQAGQ